MKHVKANLKLFRPHLVLLALLVAGGIISIASLLHIRQQTEQLFHEVYTIENAALTINTSLERIQKSVLLAGLHISQEISREESKNLEAGFFTIEEQMALIKQNCPGDPGMTAALEQSLSDLKPMQDSISNLASQKKSAALILTERQMTAIKKAQEELEVFVEAARVQEQALVASLQATQRNAVIALAFIAAASVLTSIGAGLYRKRHPK